MLYKDWSIRLAEIRHDNIGQRYILEACYRRVLITCYFDTDWGNMEDYPLTITVSHRHAYLVLRKIKGLIDGNPCPPRIIKHDLYKKRAQENLR